MHLYCTHTWLKKTDTSGIVRWHWIIFDKRVQSENRKQTCSMINYPEVFPQHACWKEERWGIYVSTLKGAPTAPHKFLGVWWHSSLFTASSPLLLKHVLHYIIHVKSISHCFHISPTISIPSIKIVPPSVSPAHSCKSSFLWMIWHWSRGLCNGKMCHRNLDLCLSLQDSLQIGQPQRCYYSCIQIEMHYI